MYRLLISALVLIVSLSFSIQAQTPVEYINASKEEVINAFGSPDKMTSIKLTYMQVPDETAYSEFQFNRNNVCTKVMSKWAASLSMGDYLYGQCVRAMKDTDSWKFCGETKSGAVFTGRGVKKNLGLLICRHMVPGRNACFVSIQVYKI